MNIGTIDKAERPQRIGAVHKSHCTFIPPLVLENLARAGVEEARLTIQQSKLSRENRAKGPVDMEMFAGATPAARSN